MVSLLRDRGVQCSQMFTVKSPPPIISYTKDMIIVQKV